MLSVDYIFFIRRDVRELRPNPEEIDELKWVNKDNMKKFLEEKR